MREGNFEQSAFEGPDRSGEKDPKGYDFNLHQEVRALSNENLVRFLEEERALDKSKGRHKSAETRQILRDSNGPSEDDEDDDPRIIDALQKAAEGSVETMDESIGYENMRGRCVHELHKRVGQILFGMVDILEGERKPLTDLELKMLKIDNKEQEEEFELKF